MNNTYIPWVEKYRPNSFDDIVLDEYNRKILENIVSKEYFPNLLFYGPPGTGKTTSIINLINSYTKLYSSHKSSKELLIHLNASDDRGIDIIRNHISSFVGSKNLFNKGLKFVILDEVDYMTKNAQIALKYLISNHNNVRFCLICNYISRIDESLQNDLLRIRFNKLPEKEIISYLETINTKEKLNFSKDRLKGIQVLFKSDIRSMINYLQINQENLNNFEILNEDKCDIITNFIRDDKINELKDYIPSLATSSNNNQKSIIKYYLNNIIKKYNLTTSFLKNIENLMHNQDITHIEYINYFLFSTTIKIKEII